MNCWQFILLCLQEANLIDIDNIKLLYYYDSLNKDKIIPDFFIDDIENIDTIKYTKHLVFGLYMPTTCPNIPSEILNPRNTWKDKSAYDTKANELADAFNKNFNQFADNANAEILEAAPRATTRV